MMESLSFNPGNVMGVEAARVAYWSKQWNLPPDRLRERVAELAMDAVNDALANSELTRDLAGSQH